MVDETMPAYTRHHWAKSDRRDPQRIHLLEHHLADVGACFEGLLRQPTIRQRLARTAGRDDLDAATVARLCVFAALHDIGKVNVGFQTQIWRREDLPGGRRPASFQRVGHIRDLVPVLDNNGDTETSGWFFSALGFEEGVLGSPAHARIDLPTWSDPNTYGGFPRPRGDRPWTAVSTCGSRWVPPPTRG